MLSDKSSFLEIENYWISNTIESILEKTEDMTHKTLDSALDPTRTQHNSFVLTFPKWYLKLSRDFFPLIPLRKISLCCI